MLAGSILVMWGLSTAACSGPPDVERDPAPLLQTSALRYTVERHDFGYSTTIPFTYRNETGVDVLVDHCDGDVRPLLQIRRGDRWVDQWYPFMDDCQGPPIRIAPGDVYSDTVRVIGAPPGSNVTPAFVFEDVEGVYRLYWFQASLSDSDSVASGDAARAAALPWRVSNPFVLTF
jgi:hypothetical protein